MSKKKEEVKTEQVAVYKVSAKGHKYTDHVKELRANGTPIGVGGVNAKSWAAIQLALADGPQSLVALKAAVGTHERFVTYALRRGWLEVVA